MKKGVRSAGAQRQYSGTAGRIENCQLGVFLAYAGRHGRALIDRELYLPESWIADRDRCADAGVPESRWSQGVVTEPRLAEAMIGRALAADVTAGWVTADSAYGRDGRFRAFLESHRMPYVVEVPVRDTVTDIDGRRRVDTLISRAPAEAWHRVAAGPGVRGEREYDFAWATLPVLDDIPAGFVRTLLARRSLDDPADIAYYVCFHPDTIDRGQIVAVAGAELGDRGMLPSRQRPMRPRPLPSPQIRRLVPAHHPGHARSRLPRRHRRHRPKSPRGLGRITVAEIRRLLAIVLHPARTLTHALAASRWRRHHQNRPRQTRYQRTRLPK